MTLRDLTAKLKISVDEQEIKKISGKLNQAVNVATEKVGGFEKFIEILKNISQTIAAILVSLNSISTVVGAGLLVFLVLIFNRLYAMFGMMFSFITRIKIIRDIAGFLFSNATKFLGLFRNTAIGKSIGEITGNIKNSASQVKLITASVEGIASGASKVSGGMASAGRKAKTFAEIVSSIPAMIGNIVVASGGFFLFFKLKQMLTMVKAMKAEIQDIQIIISSFVGREGLKGIEKTVDKIAVSTNDLFSKMEARQAAAEFLKLGGTAKEFDSSIEGIAKKAAILGLNLKDATASFANAMKSGDVTSLASQGFISKQQAERFNLFSKDMDENLKKIATRFFVLNNATKLNDKQLGAFNDRIDSINAGTKRLDNVVNRFIQKFKFFSGIALITSNTLADILKAITDNRFIMFTLRVLALIGFFATLLVSMKAFLAILGFVIFKLGILNGLLTLLMSKMSIIAIIMASVFLIIEDLFVLLKGGDSFLGKYLKMFDEWILSIPIVGKMWKWLNSMIKPFITFLKKGIRTDKWVEAFKELGDVIKISLIKNLKDTINLFELIPDSIAKSFTSAKNYLAGLVGLGDSKVSLSASGSRDPSSVEAVNSGDVVNNSNNAKNNSINIQSISINASTPQEGRAAASSFVDEINKILDSTIRETELSFPVQSN